MMSRDTKYLKWSRWYDEMPSTGTLRLKRVSKKAEEQFPRKYRKMLAVEGPANVTKQLMLDYNLGLSAAWEKLQTMVNGR